MTGRFAISKSSKYWLVGLLVLFLVITFVQFDMGETQALEWHLRHGFKDRCCGVEVRVPLKYTGGDGLPWSLALNTSPGYLRSRLWHAPHGMILIMRNPRPFDAEQVRKSADWLSRRYRLIGTKTIHVAGISLNCSEFDVGNLGAFGPEDQVMCHSVGQTTSAAFYGSPALLSEFYAILEGATPTVDPIQIPRL